MRTLISTLFLLGVISQSLLADPPLASKYLWVNSQYPSHYVLYDFPTKTYVETVDCKPLWRFNLVANEMNKLTLFDPSRGMTVQVNYDGMYLKPSGATTFTKYQNGSFDTRWQFSHGEPYSGAITIKHGCEYVEYLSGATSPTFRFRQVTRNKDNVDIFDASRNMLVRLTKDSMYLRTGTNPLAFYKKGHW